MKNIFLLLGLLVFFSTLFIYNLGFYRNILFGDEPQREHASWMRKNRTYWIFSLLSSLIVILYLYYSYSIEAKVFIAILSIISFLYIIHNISIFRIKISIRNIPFLKTIIVSIIWTLITIAPQVIESHLYTSDTPWINLLGWRFFFVLPITLMFDIRDINSDPERLKTIPRTLGSTWTKIIALLSLILALYFFLLMDFSAEIYFSIAIVYLLMIISIFNSDPKRGELYYSGWFDGLMALHSIIIISLF